MRKFCQQNLIMKFSLSETIILYNLIFLGGAFWAYFAEYATLNCQRFLSRIFCFLVIFIPAACRYDIGTDYSFYVDAYNSNYLLLDYEYGFRAIANLLRFFSFPAQALFVFTSFLIYAPICFFIKRNGFYLKVILYILLFYLYSYNVIRNSIALSFLLVSLEQYFSGSKSKSYFIYSVACLFHYSTLFFLPLFILDFISVNKKILIITFISIFFMVCNNLIFLLFNTSLFLDSKYGIYVGSVHSNETDIGTGIGVFLYLVIPISSLFILLKKYDVKQRMLLYMLFCYAISYLLALKVQIFGRLSDIFLISLIYVIPYIVKKMSANAVYLRYISHIYILLLFFLFQMQIVNNKRNNVSGGHGINPFETIIK